MGFKKGEKYDFSMYVKNVDFSGTVRIYLDSPSNKSHQTEIDISNSESWRKFEAELESAATEDGGLAIEFNGSLFRKALTDTETANGNTPRCAVIW